MALPTNEHHVHSDGYSSDMGEPDEERMMEELADEIDADSDLPMSIEATPDVDVDGPLVVLSAPREWEQEYLDVIEETVRSWECRLVNVSKTTAEVRPR